MERRTWQKGKSVSAFDYLSGACFHHNQPATIIRLQRCYDHQPAHQLVIDVLSLREDKNLKPSFVLRGASSTKRPV
jgi:hypothetical protein